MNCDCKDWENQIEILNGPIVLQTIRSGGAYQYQGKPFKYCPWCSSELTADKTPHSKESKTP